MITETALTGVSTNTRLDGEPKKFYHKYITTNRGAENGRNQSRYAKIE
jgi:hypothetical protein